MSNYFHIYTAIAMRVDYNIRTKYKRSVNVKYELDKLMKNDYILRLVPNSSGLNGPNTTYI